MRGFGFAMLLPIVLIVALWLVGQVVGFEVSLLGSLGLSILLTLILNVAMRGFRGRRHYRP